MTHTENEPQTSTSPLRKRLKVSSGDDSSSDGFWSPKKKVDDSPKSSSSSASSDSNADGEPLELCPFTPTVKRGLRDGDSESVWNMV